MGRGEKRPSAHRHQARHSRAHRRKHPTVHGDQRLSLTFLFILFPLFALNVLWHHFFIAVYFLKDHAYGSVWTGLDHRPPTESLLHIDERWGAVRLRISDA